MKLSDIDFSRFTYGELQAFVYDLERYVRCRKTAELLAADLEGFLSEKLGKGTCPDLSASDVLDSRFKQATPLCLHGCKEASLREEEVSRVAQNWWSRPNRSFGKKGKNKDRPRIQSTQEPRRETRSVSRKGQGRCSLPPTVGDVSDAIRYLKRHPEVDPEDDVEDLEIEFEKGPEKWNVSVIESILLKVKRVEQRHDHLEYQVDRGGWVISVTH